MVSLFEADCICDYGGFLRSSFITPARMLSVQCNCWCRTALGLQPGVCHAGKNEGTLLPLGGFLASSSRDLPLIVSQNLFCPSCLGKTLAKSVGVEKRERWRKSSITTAFLALAASVTSCGVSQSE